MSMSTRARRERPERCSQRALLASSTQRSRSLRLSPPTPCPSRLPSSRDARGTSVRAGLSLALARRKTQRGAAPRRGGRPLSVACTPTTTKPLFALFAFFASLASDSLLTLLRTHARSPLTAIPPPTSAAFPPAMFFKSLLVAASLVAGQQHPLSHRQCISLTVCSLLQPSLPTARATTPSLLVRMRCRRGRESVCSRGVIPPTLGPCLPTSSPSPLSRRHLRRHLGLAEGLDLPACRRQQRRQRRLHQPRREFCSSFPPTDARSHPLGPWLGLAPVGSPSSEGRSPADGALLPPSPL